jgi:CRP-like cAMP-binding protein
LEESQQVSLQESFTRLRRIELFASLSDAEIESIVEKDRLLSYGPGEMLVVMGDVGGSMFVIMEGSCSVLIPNPSGGEGMTEVAQLHEGTIFGEISALTDAPRTASIRAVNHVVVQEISQRQIEVIFLNNEAAMAEFAKVMAQREAGRKAFSATETEEFELGLVERMTKTFSRLMFR